MKRFKLLQGAIIYYLETSDNKLETADEDIRCCYFILHEIARMTPKEFDKWMQKVPRCITKEKFTKSLDK